jgi:hypothetical protein
MLAAHALVKTRLLPGIALGRGPSRGWRGLAHETLDRGDDRGGLLGRRVGRHDRELRTTVDHSGEGIVPQP